MGISISNKKIKEIEDGILEGDNAFIKLAKLEGAQKMLEIVKRWLNTEPIEKEIWEDYVKLGNDSKKEV